MSLLREQPQDIILPLHRGRTHHYHFTDKYPRLKLAREKNLKLLLPARRIKLFSSENVEVQVHNGLTAI